MLQTLNADTCSSVNGLTEERYLFDSLVGIHQGSCRTLDRTQTFQNPLIKEYTLNHTRGPTII